MKLGSLYEASMAEPDFKWYENPSKEQINEVAGRDNKIHFIAFPEKRMVVFPHQISFKEFMEARGGKLHFHKEDAIFGVAQKSGLGWMLLTIANKKYMPDLDLSKWEWLDKYINTKVYSSHSGEKKFHEYQKPIPPENIEDKQIKNAKLNKTNLKDFLDKYGSQQRNN